MGVSGFVRALFSSTPPEPTCSAEVLSAFTKQLATLLGSGVDVIRALDALSRDESDPLYDEVVPKIAADLSRGWALSKSLARYPRVFPMTYVALVQAGERTGALVQVLEQVSEWLDRSSTMTRKVKSALTYPAFVVVVATVLTLGLFRSVIPGILETVEGLGVELPPPTMLLASLVAIVQSPLAWAAVVLLGGGAVAYLRSPEGRTRLVRACVHLPVVGPILISSSASRFSFTLSLLVGTGVDVLLAVRIAAESSGNPLLADDSSRVRSQVREGKELSQAIKGHALYPSVLYQLILLSEQTGKLAKLLRHACRILEDEAAGRLERMTMLLEPLILAALSVGVGFILIATLLPLATLTSSL